MQDLILENIVMTQDVIATLAAEKQHRLLIDMLTKSIRPLFSPNSLNNQKPFSLNKKRPPQVSPKDRLDSKPMDNDEKSPKGKLSLSKLVKKAPLQTERAITFIDILESCLNARIKSVDLINLLQLMQNELKKGNADLKDEFNYEELFSLFIVRRKIKLLRFLFVQKDFKFNIGLFLRALDLEAYDMAALLHKEFFRLLRNITPHDLEEIIMSMIGAFNKNNGMIDFKCYLARQFIDKMQQRHCRTLIATIDHKVKLQSKQNILVLNLNLIKTSCLLIELLDFIAEHFKMTTVRCKHTRDVIINYTKQYLVRVDRQEEMRYLLLEKDFESRDSLDLIARNNIVEFLETQLSEAVVWEIWRGAYATHDSIMSASTNHMLTWEYWHCRQDVEALQPFFKVKAAEEIEAHLMQFTVWRFSGKARMVIDWIISIAFAIYIHILVARINDTIYPVWQEWRVY